MRANWLYFLGTPSNPTEIFVYGLSLSTKCPIEYCLRKKKIDLNVGNKKIFVFRSVKNVDEEDIINGDEIYLGKLSDYVSKKVNVVYLEKFIQAYGQDHLNEEINSPISSLTNITSYYTEDYVSSPKISDDVFWNMLEKISEDTNQDFKGQYARRIGCMEFGKVFSWSETTVPFGVKVNKEHKYCFFKKPDFKEDLYVVIKIYRTKEEKIYERHIFISKDVEEYVFDYKSHMDWGIRYSVYNSEGDVIDDKAITWINSIYFTISPFSNNQIGIEDSFTKRDPKTTNISNSNAITSIIDRDMSSKEVKSFRNKQNILVAVAKEYNKGNISGKWFSKENDTLSKIIDYINHILVENMEITIIDPYLDVDIIELVMRFNKTVNVRVISAKKCITGTVPEKIKNYKNKAKELGFSLNNVKLYVLDGKFHDRFIQFSHFDTSLPRIFCLPNSINSMLRNDDFLMLELSGRVKMQANNYISELISRCNNSNLMENIFDE